MTIDLEKIEDSNHILEILLQCEDILDSLDIYVYKNWFAGEVISGPNVKRYWITFGLGYPIDKMPDPRASLRLIKYGIKVSFEKMHRKGKVNYNLYTQTEQPTDDEQIWLVNISVPRRLIDEIEDSDDFYEDDIDSDDIDDAKDAGMDNESAFKSDEQDPSMGDSMPSEPDANAVPDIPDQGPPQ